MTHKKLVNATLLESELGLPKSSVYRLAKRGLIPFYRVGPKMTGLRFLPDEVLSALRQPIARTSGDPRSRIDSQIPQAQTGDYGNHE